MHPVKSRLIRFALINGGAWLMIMLPLGYLFIQDHGTIEDAALLLVMCFVACVIGLVTTISLFMTVKKPARCEEPFVIFLCTHALIWGGGFLIATLVAPGVEDKVLLFFTWPAAAGGLLLARIVNHQKSNSGIIKS